MQTARCPQSTRGHCMSVSPTQSRERVKGRSPLWGQGAKPLGFPQSTRGHSLKVSPTQSRGRVKGGTPLQGAGTVSLLGSRGKAPWGPPINTRAQLESVTNSIARKGQGATPLGFPQSTRGHCMSVSPTQSRERVKGRSPLWGQGATPLGSPPLTASLRGSVLRLLP